ncbi:MAG: VOC family protein [Alphaproteobacteria bacterium]|nr:VOC family protein [Alphaproteobacteria bacterium]MDE2630694.1 VOC family protein [Alphaproteobacteria bacterium]
MATAAPRRPSFIPSLVYKDNRMALKWLQSAFGFDASEVLTDANGNIAHAEMSFGDGVVMIGSEWADWTKSPASLGGKNTQRVHVRVDRDLDAHCARARQAGAIIVMEPADQFYGERSYIAADLEGHHWTFSQPIKHVSNEEMEKASGLKFKNLT